MTGCEYCECSQAFNKELVCTNKKSPCNGEYVGRDNGCDRFRKVKRE